jgi:hypothetical protein
MTSAAGVLAGPALLAAGFVIAPALQLAAALGLSAAQALFGLLLLRLPPRLQGQLVRTLVGIAGAVLVSAMALAAVYAWGAFSGEYFILIPHMAELHGTANAFGFTLASRVAWNVALRQEEACTGGCHHRRHRICGQPAGSGAGARRASRGADCCSRWFGLRDLRCCTRSGA